MLDQQYNGVVVEDKWGKTYLCSACLFAYNDLGPDYLKFEVTDQFYGRYFLHDLEPAWDHREIWLSLYRTARPWQTDFSKMDTLRLRDEIIKLFDADEMRVWQLTDGWGAMPSAGSLGDGGLAAASSDISSSAVSDTTATSSNKTRPGGAQQQTETPAANAAIHNTAAVPDSPLTPLAQRQLRYQQRQQLLATTAGISDVQQAHERLAFNNDNILRAEAAQYVYKVDEYNRGHIDELPAAPVGLKLIEPESIGLELENFTDPETGFGAALFESEISGETMLTYRGTNNGVTGKQDWLTNFKQGTGLETDQYNLAMKLAAKVQDVAGDDFSIVGHSLGGGLASSGVAVTGQPGYTFNSAGLHPNTAKRQGGFSLHEVNKLITTQAVKMEVLTMAQSFGTKAVLTGVATAAGGPIAGLLTAAGLAGLSALPKAAGQMQSLPSVKGGNPVARHGMDQVIDGIEAQKTEDIQQLSDYAKAYNG